MVSFFHRPRSPFTVMASVAAMIVLFLLSFSPVKADPQEPPQTKEHADLPDPVSWMQTLDPSILATPSSFLSCLTIWTELKQNQKRWTNLGNALSAKSFIKFFPQSGFTFLARLSKTQAQEDLNTTPETPGGSPVNGMLVEKGKKLSLVSWNQGKKSTLGPWPKPASGIKNSEGLLGFLRDKLGYDAVVLAEKGPFILVGFILSPEEEGQGLLLRDSEKNIIVDSKKAQGKVLLQVLKIKGGYGVMEILLAEGKKVPIPIGSKVLLGRSEDFKKLIKNP